VFTGLTVALALVGTGASPHATLKTFAGTWIGHTRTLTITRHGHARERIYGGCCDHIIDLRFRLSHPRGTPDRAAARARVTYVRVFDASAFGKGQRVPRVGQRGTLRLKNGVITEPFIGTNYCDRKAGRRGICGA
jgi:hypothetical protein